MIEILLNAYQCEKTSVLKVIKTLDKISKGYLIVAIVNAIVVMITSLCSSWRGFLISSGIFIVLTISFVIAAKILNKKAWKENVDKYKAELDKVADILKKPEFNLYDADKIDRLVEKYKTSIEEIDVDERRKSECAANFIQIYIIPIIAFFIKNDNIPDKISEEIAWAVLMVVALLVGKSAIYALKEMYYMIMGNQREEKKHFIRLLSDLRDRDF